jgi:hypothetical protein
MYKGFKLKNLERIEVNEDDRVGSGCDGVVYRLGDGAVAKLVMKDKSKNRFGGIVGEFIKQVRAYRAGLEVAEPYNMCEAIVGGNEMLGFRMEYLGGECVHDIQGRLSLADKKDFNSKWFKFQEHEEEFASRVGFYASDTHSENAMVLPNGEIKRIDLHRWGYTDGCLARKSTKKFRRNSAQGNGDNTENSASKN